MVEWDCQQTFPPLIAECVIDVGNAKAASNFQKPECWLNDGISNLDQVDSASCSELIVPDNNFGIKSAMVDPCIEAQDMYLYSSNECAQDPTIINQNASDHSVEDPYSNTVFPHYDYEGTSPLSIWGSPMDLNHFKMEEVFQVDKEDLFQGPTLAELNANDESLFDTLDAFDFSPIESKCEKTLSSALNSLTGQAESSNGNEILKSSCTNVVALSVKGTSSCSRNSQPMKDTSFALFGSSSEFETMSTPCIKSEKCDNDDLYVKEISSTKSNTLKSQACTPSCSKDSSQINVSLPSADSKVLASRKTNESSSNTRNRTFSDNFWKIPQATATEFDFHDENTYDGSSSSSVESDDGQDEIQSPKRMIVKSKNGSEKKKPCYFWQYNTQAKGPKGSKWKQSRSSVEASSTSTSTFNDLVKSRRSSSNDLTPSPQKLYSIGVELHKLNSVINNLTPVNALPQNERPECRKEKNKLASRVCRLKKKAQYEANKLKLYGLQQEHDALLPLIDEVKKTVICKINNLCSKEFSCSKTIEQICAKQSVSTVADCQAEFVNNVLKNVEAGDTTGGLDKFFCNSNKDD